MRELARAKKRYTDGPLVERAAKTIVFTAPNGQQIKTFKSDITLSMLKNTQVFRCFKCPFLSGDASWTSQSAFEAAFHAHSHQKAGHVHPEAVQLAYLRLARNLYEEARDGY